MDTTVQKIETNMATPAIRHPLVRLARGPFLRRAWVVTAGMALWAFVPTFLLGAATQDGPRCPATSPGFNPVGEIKNQDGTLRAVIKVMSGERDVPTKAGSSTAKLMLRYFTGYNPADETQKWPVSSSAGPGPTLRSEIGDVVQITLLNQVNVEQFSGTLDSGEEGRGNGCDQGIKQSKTGVDKNWYPANDVYPNCFHGSSSANIHFHGTHVTPSTTGDNVLVNVRPNRRVTERDVHESFQQVFQRCALGQEPKKWGDLPRDWRDFQETLLREYDRTAPYQGGHGLPRDLQLWPQNQQAIDHGIWPQWYSGSYPYCFQIPRYIEDKDHMSNVRMGQAPGTHWYHSHKHGSTTLNLFNGLAGAFIITDNSPTGYDGALQTFYLNHYKARLDEKVLVIQQIAANLNLPRASARGAPPWLVNGQLTPTITMQPGQVQLWRMINATVQGFVNAQFKPASKPAGGIEFRQTAQDGVQLARKNYGSPRNGQKPITMAPANRVDLLVKAPTAKGCYELNDTGTGTIVYVVVKDDTVSMDFPKEEEFPDLPPFLHDIDPATIHVRREIIYGSKDPTPVAGGRTLRQFTIDGEQFKDQTINQMMLLDSAEEWKVYNTDTDSPNGPPIAHPFHIHVNPFQVVEVFNPNTMTEPEKPVDTFVWWDTFAIPPGKKVDGKVIPGYFKMRSRFVDFTGRYVQHCHILAHEDRGMMQLLEVVDNKTILKHH
jgi:FtsP/CotA-like multicopper oxidase with cupredoxin domain